MILIHSNVNNQMILTDSNVSKFCKNTLTRFTVLQTRGLDESSNCMDKRFFLKKIEVTGFIGRFFPLTTLEGQSKEY